MTLQAQLDVAVKAVAPIESISFGKISDKTTWVIQYQSSATQSEKDAAQAIVDSFVYDDWKEKRNGPKTEGGYGTYGEQFSVASDAAKAATGTAEEKAIVGLIAWFAHDATVKATFPKAS